jgi:hypothetical protein
MSNMSYIRFHNTLEDLQECYDHLDDDDISEAEAEERVRLVGPYRQIVADGGAADEQVRTAIGVLNAYVSGDLSLDNELLDELDTALEAAFNAMTDDGPDDYETPLTQSW